MIAFQNRSILVQLIIGAAHFHTSATKYCNNFKSDDTKLRRCMADCLGLGSQAMQQHPCEFSRLSGNVANEECGDTFYPSQRDKVVACNLDAENNGNLRNGSGVKIIIGELSKYCEYLFLSFVKYKDGRVQEVPSLIEFHAPVIAEARKHHLKVILMVGSWDDSSMSADSFTKISDDAASRVKFFESTLAVINKHKLHGVNIIWQYPGCPQNGCYRKKMNEKITTFAKDVFWPMRQQGLKVFFNVGTYVPAFTYTDDFYSELLDSVDYFIGETASQSGSWSTTFDLDNSLLQMKEVMKKFSRLVSSPDFTRRMLYTIDFKSKAYILHDASKLVLKKSFVVAPPKKHFLRVSEYCTLVRSGAYALVKNSSTQNYAQNAKHVFVYDDYYSLLAKADYARESYAGFLITGVGSDDWEGSCECGRMPHLRATAEHLKGRDCVLTPCF